MREPPLIRRIRAKHGAHPDVRIWRNATFTGWVGKFVSRTPSGIVTLQGATRAKAGLCKGSSDIIGIGPGGRFLAAEVKTPGTATPRHQQRFLDMVLELGGIAGVVGSPEEMGELIEGARAESSGPRGEGR